MNKINSLKKEVEKRVRDILADGIAIKHIYIRYIGTDEKPKIKVDVRAKL